MAVEGGKVVDGLGGTIGGPGYYSLGSMDGELAYLLGGFHKELLFSGGVAFMSGHPDLSPEELLDRANGERQAQMAWEALFEGVVKGVAAELTVVSEPREILISGRLCRIERVREELVRRLSSFGPVRRVENIASVAKEAAQGAAILADGLAGGQYRELVAIMEIRGAMGTVLDHLYISNAEAMREKYLA
jgi:predicted butyrate kinase (DUF1464 family)